MTTAALDDDAGLSQRLRSAGLRLTIARLGILRILADSDEPLSAQTVFARMAVRDTSVCAATVYRVLTELEQRGLARRDWHAGRRASYRMRPAAGATCRISLTCAVCACSRMTVDDALHERLLELASRLGLSPIEQTIDVRIDAGLACRECQATTDGD